MLVLTLSPGRDHSARRRHPWVFSGAVRERQGDGSDGLVEVRSSTGELVGRGMIGSGRSIVARLWTFGDEVFDGRTIGNRFAAARKLRKDLIPPDTTGYRTLHSEGDHVPGVIAVKQFPATVRPHRLTASATRDGPFRRARVGERDDIDLLLT